MSADRRDYAEHPAIGQERVCDACSEGGIIAEVDPDTEAYICQRCHDQHELAVAWAAGVIGPAVVGRQFNAVDVARQVIDAYFTALNNAHCSVVEQ